MLGNELSFMCITVIYSIPFLNYHITGDKNYHITGDKNYHITGDKNYHITGDKKEQYRSTFKYNDFREFYINRFAQQPRQFNAYGLF